MKCDGIYSLFGTKLNQSNVMMTNFTKKQRTMFEQYAKLDKNLTLNKLGGGFYQCFCMKFPDSKQCNDYNFDKNLGTALNFAVCGLVNIINYALQLCVQMLAASVGYDTLSEQFATVMVCQFLSSYVNTAILSIIVSADFRYTPVLQWVLPIKQQYTDLSNAWWVKIGPNLVITVIIQSIMPVFGVFIAFATKLPLRWYD